MKLVADLHVHSVASGHAYSTIAENINAAREKGLEMIAITDHGPRMPGAPHLYHFGNLQVIPGEKNGVQILRGAEANICDFAGHIDIPPVYLDRLDIVAAGFHTYCFPGGTVAENTQAMINAMQNPYIDIIVHPGNPEFQVDPEQIVAASLKYGIALEINNSSFGISRKGSYDNCMRIVQLVAQCGSMVVVGSDAHWADDVGKFDRALELLDKAGVKEEQVLNTSVEKIKRYIQDRRRLPAVDLDIPRL